MHDEQLLQQRLINQHLIKPKYSSASKLVNYLGAVQAQDFAMSKWAIGLRTTNSTQEKVEAAINKGSILRTHILRPTWHLVSAEDIYWMLELSAQKIKAIMRSNEKRLGIDEPLFKKTNRIIEKALSEHEQLNRDEIIQLFNKHKIIINENRLAHFLMRAELEAIICSGKIIGNKNTYALLAKRITKKKTIKREEALCMLAKKYFQSRGPAAIADFAWWSGLSINDATKALHAVESTLHKETINNREYYFKSSNNYTSETSTVFALPAFDEYLISYKHRSHMLHSIKKNISVNGIFWPVILANGKVAGMWNRRMVNNKLTVQTEYFSKPSTATKNDLMKSFNAYAKFLHKQVIVDKSAKGNL